MDFAGMKRRELQALCKRHGLPAGGTNADLVARLDAALSGAAAAEEEEDVVGVVARKGCLKRSVGDAGEAKKVTIAVEESRGRRLRSRVVWSPVVAKTRGKRAEAGGTDSAADEGISARAGENVAVRRSRRNSVNPAEVEEVEEAVAVGRKQKPKSQEIAEQVAVSAQPVASCRVMRKSSLSGTTVLLPPAVEKKRGKGKAADGKNKLVTEEQAAGAQGLSAAAGENVPVRRSRRNSVNPAEVEEVEEAVAIAEESIRAADLGSHPSNDGKGNPLLKNLHDSILPVMNSAQGCSSDGRRLSFGLEFLFTEECKESCSRDVGDIAGEVDGGNKSSTIYCQEQELPNDLAPLKSAMCSLQGWADLPEGLLQSIIPLLGSFLELLAFAGTCHSWRAAFSSYPSKSTFCTLLPPLLVRPHIRLNADHLPSRSDDGYKLRTCQVIDLANLRTALRCQIPEDAFETLCFAGSSYGQLICGGGRNCGVFDVFSGARILAPQLSFSEDTFFYSGMLTAPLTSHNAHLLVCASPEGKSSQCSLLDWPVGSDSWSELRLNDLLIEQIVEFKGQFIALVWDRKLHTLSLAPQLGLQEIATVWWNGMDKYPYMFPWLVVCGDMLLIVGYDASVSLDVAPVNYKAHRLDMSTVPAVWVEVEKLENHVLFIGEDVRGPRFLASTWDDGVGGTTACTMHIAMYPGSCTGLVMRQMLCGIQTMTLIDSHQGVGRGNCSPSGCPKYVLR